MASKGATRRKRSARPEDSPLTEPRYLFARDGESLARLAEVGLAECRTRLGELVSTAGPRTIPNLLVPYDRLMLPLQEVLSQTHFLFDVHPDPDVRKVADHWYQEAQRFATELSLNRPLYDAFIELDASGEDDETRYAVEKILRDFRLAGVDRDEATRARVQALRDEITAIGQDFDRIIREDVRSIQVGSPRELDGLPEDFVEGHAPGSDGKITLTTNYPDSIPVFRYARNADVRRRLQFEYLNRGHPANLDVLARLLAKRHELASVLGYESYAEYIVQDKMVRSSKAVADFLAKVTAASAERAQEDVARLLERKRHDVPGAAALDAWDPNYYSEVVRAERFAFDAKLLRPYFAFTKVRDGLFALTGELFGVRYERVSGVPVWHGSVEVYDVYDGPRRLGRFYLDLHPRKDKYTHAAAQGLVTGIRGAQQPQAALMCNFPDPADGPALMDYREVETFFHEFGHLLHSIFQGHGRWVKNTDDGLEWDFIEAPSQMLEEWVRDPEALGRFAFHYETGEVRRRLAGARRAAPARIRDPVPGVLPPRSDGTGHDENVAGRLRAFPARAALSGYALPVQLRPPQRLLRDLLHVHVVPRDRKGPVLEIPGGRLHPRPEDRSTVPRDDPGARQREAGGPTRRGLPRTAALVRRLRGVAARVRLTERQCAASTARK